MSAALQSRRPIGWSAHASLAVALAAAALFGAQARMPRGGAGAHDAGSPASATAMHPAEFFDERAFALALRAVDAAPPQPMPGARALIIPHHWTAGPLIVGPLRDLAATREIRRVILIGPNHTNSGGAVALTTDRGWSTPFGATTTDAAAVGELTAAGAEIEPDVLTYEHSVAGIVPALRYALPGAAIVPVIIKGTADVTDVRRLAAALAPLLADDGTVLLASVDFSHGLPRPAAEAKNRETREILQRLAAPELFGLGNDHLDSPASIALAIDAARTAGATAFELRADTTSAAFTPGEASVTSYLVGYLR